MFHLPSIKTFITSGDGRSQVVKKNIMGTFVLRITNIIISLLLVPATIGYVNADLYGVWLALASIMTWLNFADIGFTLGLKNKLAEALAKEDYSRGKALLMDFIRKMYAEHKPMGQAFHRQAMDPFRLYMIVGGMPQAVKKYIETKDFEAVDAAKRDVLTIYRNDIFNYAGELADKVVSIFDQIPSQLSKHEKKFRLSALKPGSKYRDWDDAFFWLKDARVVNICYNSTDPNIGLKMNEDRTTLKCYLNDTGLLISHAFDEKGIVSSEIYQKLLFGKLEVNEGMLMENIVSQMLTAAGNKLFFYSKSSEDAEERMEIDFLIQKEKVTSRHNIRPTEVKSGKNYTLSSLTKCMKKFGEYMTTPTVLHAADYKVEDGVTYLPLYMTPLL